MTDPPSQPPAPVLPDHLGPQAGDVTRLERGVIKGHGPFVLWFTGLSGAGKSTIANLVERRLHGRGRHTVLLDGDNVRLGLNRDLGFTDSDRVENIRRVAEVARLMADAGLIVIVAFISPFRADRAMARARMADGEFAEVFVDTPLAMAEARDVKGLYKKARAGQLKNFTGIDSPYEPPLAPALRIDTTVMTAEDAADRIVAFVLQRTAVSDPVSSSHDPIVALSSAGLEALKRGDVTRAAQLGEEATRLAPTRSEGWLLLCAALTRLGSVDDERAMADALRNLAPGDPARRVIEVDRTRALALRGRPNDASDLCDRLSRLPDLTPPQHNTLGSVYALIGRYEASLTHCLKAAAAMPENAVAQYNLGTALRYVGRIDEAERLYEKTLAIDPDHSLAISSLSGLRKWKPDNNHVARIRAAIARAPAGSETVARLHYALFKELDDLSQTREAWQALEAGARTAHALFPFNAAEKQARTAALIETFPKEVLAQKPPHNSPGPRPIFIYGLPRSGTTLTERILGAHSKVTPMGETVGFTQALRTVIGQPRAKEVDADAVRRTRHADWAEVARLYQANTAYLGGDAEVVTEKLPHNYEFVGPIAMAFPDAPLVHVRRAPMDSLFGAFRLLFGEGAYVWSYDFEGLADNYRAYRRLMAHWRSALGDRITEVTLETLINNQEEEIRRLVSRCGLPFEEACLSPHDADGGVSTASSTQVRAPINRQGVGAWRRYAAELEPLPALLERDGFVDANGDPIWD